jgi:hypothetical protein
MRRLALVFAIGALATSAVAAGPAAAPASASFLSKVCGIAGAFSGIAGKACGIVADPGSLLSTGKKLLGGLLGASGSTAAKVAGLAALAVWVIGGAKFAVDSVMKALSATTEPNVVSTWFSAAYWRIVGIAALLTLPFLFAAAIQSLLRSDLAMLLRAAFGYLPLAMLAIAIAGPVTMLLLSASDEMCSLVTAAAGSGAPSTLTKIGLIGAGGVGAPFFGFLVAALTAAGALVLWLELVVREAAVYVIVMMLPLAFAAMVWPARRVWAVRGVELLIALILSKFAIVAVIVLGGNAIGHLDGISSGVAGIAMLLMAAFAPWAMLRLLPFAEVASAATGSFGQHGRDAASRIADGRSQTAQAAHSSQDVAETAVAAMHANADQVRQESVREDAIESADEQRLPVAAAASRAVNGAGTSNPTAASGSPAPCSPAAGEPRLRHEPADEWDAVWQRDNAELRPVFDAEGQFQAAEPPPEDEPS